MAKISIFICRISREIYGNREEVVQTEGLNWGKMNLTVEGTQETKRQIRIDKK